MGSGCGDLIVERILRPPGKLPVPVALNAGSPTLFGIHYSGLRGGCKQVFSNFCPNGEYLWIVTIAVNGDLLFYVCLL